VIEFARAANYDPGNMGFGLRAGKGWCSINPEWDPAQYLRFTDERLRPAIDLAAHIEHPGARRVVDLGCGTGSALPCLAARFPHAVVVGVDGSEAMLSKAAAAGFATELADIAAWRPATAVDVIFSNAALHWLDDHRALLPRLLSCLAPGGVLAVQMPAMHDRSLRALQAEVAASGPWAAKLSGVASAPPVMDPGAYYDCLTGITAGVDIWVTEYLHVLQGDDPVVEWARGTSLRPYLAALERGEQEAFLAAYSRALRPHYPPRANGAVLLPFRRLFIVARL
jgi:trans-aconitate 2-methyltransferase